MSYQSRGTGRASADTGFLGLVGGTISIGVAVVSVWGLVCAARITLSGLSLLIDTLTNGGPADIVRALVLNGIGGVLGGVAVVVLRSWARKSGHLSQSFVSALFNKGLAAPRLDGIFLGRVLIGGIVGFLVGLANGAAGFISFPQFLSESGGTEVFHNTVYPIVTFLGGGFGGPGGTDFWALLFLLVVIVAAALLIGVLAGFLLHLVLAGVGGTIKGGTKAYVTKILTERTKGEKIEESHPIRAGMTRGLFIGLIVGILESIFTILGVVRFVGAR
jgi:hypothetical protein